MAHSWVLGFDGYRIKLEIAFDSAPSVALGATVWTDVSTDVRSVEIHTGRATNFDDYQPGTATFVLGNRDRDYDPNHASGPYYGKLLPRKRVRISTSYAASPFVPQYTGYLLGWPQTYDLNTSDATVTVNAVDGFSVLQDVKLVSLYEYEVRQDNPLMWYRLGDANGESFYDSAPGHAGGLSGASTAVVDGIPLGSGKATFFAAGDALSKQNVPWPNFPFTIEFWYETPGDTITPTNAVIPFQLSTPPLADLDKRIWFQIIGGVGGGVFVEYRNNASTFTMSAFKPVSVGHIGYNVHIVATFTSTAITLYFDGVSTSGSVSGTPPNPGESSIVLPRALTATGISAFTGVLDELSVYGTALSAARVAVHSFAGLFGADTAPFGFGVGSASGTIVTKALDIAAWPTADRAIAAGTAAVVTGDLRGQSALDFIKKVERSEQGRFYIDKTGIAVFRDQNYTITLGSSATFGDANALSVEARYSGIAFDYSTTFVRNKIVATSINGTSYTTSDATSITDHLEVGEQLDDLLLVDEAAMRALADRRLANFSQPRLRVTSLEIKPRRDPTNLFPLVRDLQLTDKVTVKHRPQGVGAPISPDVLIEGISHRATADGEYTVTYFLSPSETDDPSGGGASYMIFDNATYGKWDFSRFA